MGLRTALAIFVSSAIGYYIVGRIAETIILNNPFPLSNLLLVLLPSPSDAAIDFAFTILKCLIVGGIPTGVLVKSFIKT